MLLRMLKFGLFWCFAWCAAGAFAGFMLTRGPRDPRAISHEFYPFVVGIPSAVLGGVAGMFFVFMSPAIESRRRKAIRYLALLGAALGFGLGLLYMRVVANTYLTLIVCTLFGAALGAVSPWLEKIS